MLSERDLRIMEKTLSAYSDEEIRLYFERVQREGLTEHGFPRLAAGIGILISHGRRQDLLPLFTQMYDFCCKTIPFVKAANDFSVREIVCCLLELEAAGIFPKEKTDEWRLDLAKITPEKSYNKYAVSPEDTVQNWALFTCVSEFFRQKAGICNVPDFIDLQVLQQSQFFDENGMYRDHNKIPNHQPIVYDLVPRMLYSLLFDFGYRGPEYERIDKLLKKAALLTLKMQSPLGEIPFGGRSNQFLHNEPLIISIFEYEAKRYHREGNHPLAARFKAAAERAKRVIETWLEKAPIRHIKNRFATETGFGCESYAYFDKYMITLASNLYVSTLIRDDTIPFTPREDTEPAVATTSDHFHKLFLKCGGYGAELDLDADPHYDAFGLGRVHRAGAPSTLCLSCPCPPEPSYTVDIEPPALAAASVIQKGDALLFAMDGKACYEILKTTEGEELATARLLCRFENGACITEEYRVSKRGVEIRLSGQGEIGFTLPAFFFDGEVYPLIRAEENSLCVSYEGYTCRYETSGTVSDTGRLGANRNGHYKAYLATGKDTLSLRITIEKD